MHMLIKSSIHLESTWTPADEVSNSGPASGEGHDTQDDLRGTLRLSNVHDMCSPIHPATTMDILRALVVRRTGSDETVAGQLRPHKSPK